MVQIVGQKEQFLTSKLIIDSFQKHPKWSDDPGHFLPKTTHKNTAIIIKMYGVYCGNNLVYDKVSQEISLDKGKEIKLSADKPMCWGVCPVFTEHESVDAAHHVIPLFSGAPPDAFIKLMETRGPNAVLIKFALSKSIIKTFKTAAVLKINIWDALYEEQELFDEMKKTDSKLLTAAGVTEKYYNLVEDGPKESNLVANAMKDQNVTTPTNTQVKKAYESLGNLMNIQFKKLLET